MTVLDGPIFRRKYYENSVCSAFGHGVSFISIQLIYGYKVSYSIRIVMRSNAKRQADRVRPSIIIYYGS